MIYRFEIDICFDLEKGMKEFSVWKDAEDEIYRLKQMYENKIVNNDEKIEIEENILKVFRDLIKTLEIEEEGIDINGNEEYHYYEGYSYDGDNRISYTIYSYKEENYV